MGDDKMQTNQRTIIEWGNNFIERKMDNGTEGEKYGGWERLREERGEHDKKGGGGWFSAVDKRGWLIVYYHCSDQCFVILSFFTSRHSASRSSSFPSPPQSSSANQSRSAYGSFLLFPDQLCLVLPLHPRAAPTPTLASVCSCNGVSRAVR